MKWTVSLSALLFSILLSASLPADEVEFTLPSGNAIAFTRYPGTGNKLLLWFASERGMGLTERQAANELASKGFEVWLIDLASALFLPQTPGSLDGIDARDMQALMERASSTGARLCIYASGRAAVPVLRGLAEKPGIKAQVLLMHPNFYSRVDALAGADYFSFGNLGALEVIILQPRRSAATPWVESQIEALRQMGARPILQILERLREGFWVREDATDYEISVGKRLSERMLDWMKLAPRC